MRISTKGRGIIKAQQGTVARPNPKENKDNPDRVNVQQQGFRGANVNMKDANGNYYIDPNRQSDEFEVTIGNLREYQE